MKRVVAIVVLVAFVANCGFRLRKKTPSLQVQRFAARSEYIDKVIVIDAERREQLNLFPGIEGFKEAKFTGVAGGGYEVDIATDTERLAAGNRDPNAMVILLDYIDSYEKIAEARTLWEVKWGIIDYDTLALPITRHEVNRALDRTHAIGCGVAGGCLTSLAVVGALAGIAYLTSRDGTSSVGGGVTPEAVGEGIAIMMLVVGGIVAAGSIGGCLIGSAVARSDRKAALSAIKKARMPRLLE